MSYLSPQVQNGNFRKNEGGGEISHEFCRVVFIDKGLTVLMVLVLYY